MTKVKSAHKDCGFLVLALVMYRVRHWVNPKVLFTVFLAVLQADGQILELYVCQARKTCKRNF